VGRRERMCALFYLQVRGAPLFLYFFFPRAVSSTNNYIFFSSVWYGQFVMQRQCSSDSIVLVRKID
jgi:hypothetical protein